MGCLRKCRQGPQVRGQNPRILGCSCKAWQASILLEIDPQLVLHYNGCTALLYIGDTSPLRPVGVYLPRDVHHSLPPTPPHEGESGSDGTLTRKSLGVKTIDEHGVNPYACLFDKNCASTMPAVFVFSLSTTSNKGGESGFGGTLTP
jgi:hypothetical protein